MKVILLLDQTAVVDLPAGQTAASLAASFGITDTTKFKSFDEADFDAASYSFPTAFALAADTVSFSLPNAKTSALVVLDRQTKILIEAAVGSVNPTALAAQGFLASGSRIASYQTLLDNVNTIVVAADTKETNIGSAATVQAVAAIVCP